MDEPPQDYAICDCCGTEFGYDDFKKSWDELRQQWIEKGAKWKSRVFLAPKDWSPIVQLHQLGYEVSKDDLARIQKPAETNFYTPSKMPIVECDSAATTNRIYQFNSDQSDISKHYELQAVS